jgi:cysteinyl-tRNA synthetase
MATELLGPELDIHCGGVDNIFPHHEAEIAQSECCTGRTFVRYWLHCAHLMVDGQKMSKSLGNFYTLRDLVAKGYTGREVRYALITVNYRLPCNFTLPGLDAARTALARLDQWTARLADYSRNTAPETTPLANAGDQFLAHLDDDLNISAAMGCLFDLVRDSNKAMDASTLSQGQAAAVLQTWTRINQVLALEPYAQEMPAELRALVEERAKARSEKNWALSDQLRDRIQALGWSLKDTKDGQKLMPAQSSTSLPNP